MTTSDAPKSRWSWRLVTLIPAPFLALAMAILFYPEQLQVRPDAAIYLALAILLIGAAIGFFAMRFMVRKRRFPVPVQTTPNAVAKAMGESRLFFGIGFAALSGWTMAAKYWDGSVARGAAIAFGFGAIGGVLGWGAGHLFAVTMRAIFQPPKDR